MNEDSNYSQIEQTTDSTEPKEKTPKSGSEEDGISRKSRAPFDYLGFAKRRPHLDPTQRNALEEQARRNYPSLPEVVTKIHISGVKFCLAANDKAMATLPPLSNSSVSRRLAVNSSHFRNWVSAYIFEQFLVVLDLSDISRVCATLGGYCLDNPSSIEPFEESPLLEILVACHRKEPLEQITCSDLLKKLKEESVKHDVPKSQLPVGAPSLGKELRRLRPFFNKYGIDVDPSGRNAQGRFVRFSDFNDSDSTSLNPDSSADTPDIP